MSASIILIEDDPVQQKVAQLYVTRYQAFEKYTVFTKARVALTFIENNRSDHQLLPDVILLDLHMPDFSGWDFLESFAGIQASIAKSIDIYILSSTMDPLDEKRARSYSAVKGFYSKPISKGVIQEISGKGQSS